MPYSQKVLDRFESVLEDPTKHSVGRFDPSDPNFDKIFTKDKQDK